MRSKETFLFGQLLDLFFKARNAFLAPLSACSFPNVCRPRLLGIGSTLCARLCLSLHNFSHNLTNCLTLDSAKSLLLAAVDSFSDGTHTDHVDALHVVNRIVFGCFVRRMYHRRAERKVPRAEFSVRLCF